MARRLAGLWVGMAVALGAGCGAEPPPPAAEPKAEPAERARRSGGPSFESEIGALDESKTKQIFVKAAEKLNGCFAKGTQRVPYLAGNARFVVRVAKDGAARWVFVKDSSLGDRETETCMLAVLKDLAWPKPEGGEGLAESEFTFDPGDGERPPVAWSPEQLGPSLKRAKGALSQCRKTAGAKAMKATLYVETDGHAGTIGVSSADERGESAVACVIGALKGLKFPSPGSYASKVSVPID